MRVTTYIYLYRTFYDCRKDDVCEFGAYFRYSQEIPDICRLRSLILPLVREILDQKRLKGIWQRWNEGIYMSEKGVQTIVNGATCQRRR
jgi:hypothetical protein